MGTPKDSREIQLFPYNLNPRQLEPKLISLESPSYIYCYFALGNSNGQLSRSDFCFISDQVPIILPSKTQTMLSARDAKKSVLQSETSKKQTGLRKTLRKEEGYKSEHTLL